MATNSLPASAADYDGAPSSTAASEWRSNWKLPLAAMLGYSMVGLQSFAFGPFIGSLRSEFGWSMTQVLAGLSVSAFLSIFLSTFAGIFVDRFGPRRVGITGLLIMSAAFALLGSATGGFANWLMLWAMIAVGVVLVQSNVWTSAVVTRFDRARGMAMAIALSGGALSAATAPLLATMMVESFGWRWGFVGVSVCWLAFSLPVVLLYFRGSRDGLPKNAADPIEVPEPTGLKFRDGVRTKAFVCLLISFGTFAFYSSVMAPNLVPLLKENGLAPMSAAAVASVMGIAGVLSRLAVGFLLDRYPGNIIGFVTQMLPLIGCSILLLQDPGLLLLAFAVATFGIATGAEMDVALYLASRHFGLKSFAALLGAIMACGAATATLGPLSAGWVHDVTGSYDRILITVMALMAVGATAVGLIGRTARPSPHR